MSPLLGYFLGIFTVIIIFVPFWYLAKVNKKIEPTYKSFFCSSIGSSSSKAINN